MHDALYHIDRVVRETGKVVDNGFQEIYVNAMIKDGSEVSELMKIFVDDDVYNNKFPKTSEGKHRYKETEGGLKVMCEIMEKIAEESKLELLIDLVKDGIITIAEAARRINMTEDLFSENMKKQLQG